MMMIGSGSRNNNSYALLIASPRPHSILLHSFRRACVVLPMIVSLQCLLILLFCLPCVAVSDRLRIDEPPVGFKG
jgi:hypothetical protein